MAETRPTFLQALVMLGCGVLMVFLGCAGVLWSALDGIRTLAWLGMVSGVFGIAFFGVGVFRLARWLLVR